MGREGKFDVFFNVVCVFDVFLGDGILGNSPKRIAGITTGYGIIKQR